MLDAGSVCDAFGLGRARGPLVFAARGELGRVHRLETDRGVWAVKELLGEIDPPARLADNAAFQGAVREAGVFVPRVVPAVDGAIVVDGVRVYEWVDLEPDARVEPSVAAGLLARIHDVRWPAPAPPHPFFSEPVDESVWDELGSAAGPWAPALRARRDDLIRAAAIVRSATFAPLQTCHLDFNADNVLVAADGRAVVVDWENAGAGVAAHELASALHEFTGDDLSVARSMRRAYGGTVELTVESFATAFAFEANLVAFYARRWLGSPDGSEDRERSAWRLAQIDANPLTVERAERLVSAAGQP